MAWKDTFATKVVGSVPHEAIARLAQPVDDADTLRSRLLDLNTLVDAFTIDSSGLDAEKRDQFGDLATTHSRADTSREGACRCEVSKDYAALGIDRDSPSFAQWQAIAGVVVDCPAKIRASIRN